MGGILGACNAISDYLHTLNMGSTLFRLILAMFLGCLIGIDRGMKKRVAGVKTHMIVCMGATLVMMTGDFIHVFNISLHVLMPSGFDETIECNTSKNKSDETGNNYSRIWRSGRIVNG